MTKKSIVTALIVSLSFTAMVAPRTSHAVIGIAATASGFGAPAGIPLIILGTIFTVGGICGIGVTEVVTTRRGVFVERYWGNGLSTFFTVLGLILLKEEGGQKVHATELSDEQVRKYQLTPEQTSAYNSEIAEMNSINQKMEEDVKGMEFGSPAYVDQIKTSWEHYKDGLSEGTLQVIDAMQRAVVQTAAQSH